MQSFVNFRFLILMVFFINQYTFLHTTTIRSPTTEPYSIIDKSNFVKRSDVFKSIDQWSVTKINVKKQVYSWSIVNFSLNGKKTGEYIESPVFTENSNSNYKWRLKLYPNGYNGQLYQTTTQRYRNTAFYYNDYGSSSYQNSNSDVNNAYSKHMALHLSLESNSDTMITVSSKFALLNSKDELFFPKDAYVGTISKNDNSGIITYYNDFVKKDFVMDKVNDLLPDDQLTIVVEISINAGQTNSTGSCSASPNISSNNHLDNFETLLEDELFSDITFRVKNYEFKAHRAILASVSSVFLDEFNNLQKSNNTAIEINIAEPKVFKEMLRFAYTGKVEKIEKNAQKLLPLAHHYDITQLKNMCELALCQDLNSGNAMDLLQLATNANATYLKVQTLKYITTHSQSVVNSPKFMPFTCKTEDLISIIQTLINNSST